MQTVRIAEAVTNWFTSQTVAAAEIPQPVLDWYGTVVELNYRLFFSIAFGFLHDPDDAEDAVQSAAFKGLHALSDLDEPEVIVGWLAQITRSVCLDLLRRRSRQNVESIDAHIVRTKSAHVERSDDIEIDDRLSILMALNHLPESQATVVRLKYLEDLEVAEIASRLGLKTGTVHVRLHRALRSLAQSERLRTIWEHLR